MFMLPIYAHLCQLPDLCQSWHAMFTSSCSVFFLTYTCGVSPQTKTQSVFIREMKEPTVSIRMEMWCWEVCSLYITVLHLQSSPSKANLHPLSISSASQMLLNHILVINATYCESKDALYLILQL